MGADIGRLKPVETLVNHWPVTRNIYYIPEEFRVSVGSCGTAVGAKKKEFFYSIFFFTFLLLLLSFFLSFFFYFLFIMLQKSLYTIIAMGKQMAIKEFVACARSLHTVYCAVWPRKRKRDRNKKWESYRIGKNLRHFLGRLAFFSRQFIIDIIPVLSCVWLHFYGAANIDTAMMAIQRAFSSLKEEWKRFTTVPSRSFVCRYFFLSYLHLLFFSDQKYWLDFNLHANHRLGKLQPHRQLRKEWMEEIAESWLEFSKSKLKFPPQFPFQLRHFSFRKRCHCLTSKKKTMARAKKKGKDK